MSDIGQMVQEPVDGGCDPGVAASVAARIFVAGASAFPFRASDEDKAERARARNADRQRRWRNARNVTSNADNVTPPHNGSNVTAPSGEALHNVTEEGEPSRARDEVLPLLTEVSKEERKKDAQREQARLISIEFEEHFWPAYPRRVAKADAMKAFAAARSRKGIDLATILAGLERYKRDKPDYADWKHPGPWLRAERWNDEHHVNGSTPSAVFLEMPDFDYGADTPEN